MNTCKDCKFFVQGERHSGTCLKKPYAKSKGGHTYKTPDGKPIKFCVQWSRISCKEHFERRETEEDQ